MRPERSHPRPGRSPRSPRSRRAWLRRLGVGLAAVVAAAAVLVAGGLVALRVATTPQAQGRLDVAGLTGPVSVTRDAWGVPHIRASARDEDAVFALGFVHWQDRAWQMDLQRRITRGQLAEILGPPALERDRFLRTLGFFRAAESALPALSPRARALVAAYTAGVNAAQRQGVGSPEFRILAYTPRPWSDVDSIAWSKMMAFDLGGNYTDELVGLAAARALGPDRVDEVLPPYPPGGPTILSRDELTPAMVRPAPTTPTPASVQAPGAAALAGLDATRRAAAALGLESSPDKGSNNWVVSGAHTASGKPLLADDPHLGLSSPMLWYLADVRGPGLAAIGATIPGLPAVVIGRNDRIAWGVTNTGPDVQDLYVEPQGTPIAERTERIAVKGRPDETISVRSTRHGPVVSDLGVGAPRPDGSGVPAGPPGSVVALRWTALDPGDTSLDAFLGIGAARNWVEFTAALRHYVAPSQNFVYADVDGTIGYYAPGRIPIRRGHDGSVPVPGDGRHEWAGFVPFEELPHALDPGDGVIVSANNKVAPPEYRHAIAGERMWAEPDRARRITQLLSQRGPALTVDDMAAIQHDATSGVWAALKPHLLATTPRGDVGRRALARLATWDGVEDVDSIEATIFEAWLLRLRHLADDELGAQAPGGGIRPAAVVAQLAADGPLCRDAAAGITDCAQLLTATLAETTRDLSSRFGPAIERWEWGRVHDMTSAHAAFGTVPLLGPLFGRAAPHGGGTNTVDVAEPANLTLAHRRGASYRQIVDLADPNASRYVGTTGQGGGPFHPHAGDQEDLYLAGRYVPMSTDPAHWGRTRELTLDPASP